MNIKRYIDHYQILQNVTYPDSYLRGFYEGCISGFETSMRNVCPSVCSGCGDPENCGNTPIRCTELLTAIIALCRLKNEVDNE